MNGFSIAVGVAATLAFLVVSVLRTWRAKVIGVSVVLLLMAYVVYFGVHLAIRRAPLPAQLSSDYGSAWWAGASQVQQHVDDMLGGIWVLAVVLALMAIVKERPRHVVGVTDNGTKTSPPPP